MKPSTVSNLAMAAAFAGLLGGTAARLNAQPLPGHSGTSSGPRSGLEAICPCHRALWTDLHFAGMGRQHPHV